MSTEKKPRFTLVDRRTPRTVKTGDVFMIPTGPASIAEAAVERQDELGNVYASMGGVKLVGRFGLVNDSLGEYSGEMWLWEEMRP